MKSVDTMQPNNYQTTNSSRDVDVPKDENPLTGTDKANGEPLHRWYNTPYQPAIDAQGNADCQNGQDGYIKGPLGPSYGRYGFKDGRLDPANLHEAPPHDSLYENPGSGGNWVVAVDNLPGLAGGTYVTRRLGIANLRDIP
jgi:hypothetical protein